MKLIGVTGLTCSGKTTFACIFKNYGISTIDIGEIVRTCAEKENYNGNIQDYSLISHEKYGNLWSLSKALEILMNNNTKVSVISGLRLIIQYDFLLNFCDDFLLINIYSPYDLRLDRFLKRKRNDSSNTVSAFAFKEDIENTFWKTNELIKRAKITIENTGDINKLTNEAAKILNNFL